MLPPLPRATIADECMTRLWAVHAPTTMDPLTWHKYAFLHITALHRDTVPFLHPLQHTGSNWGWTLPRVRFVLMMAWSGADTEATWAGGGIWMCQGIQRKVGNFTYTHIFSHTLSIPLPISPHTNKRSTGSTNTPSGVLNSKRRAIIHFLQSQLKCISCLQYRRQLHKLVHAGCLYHNQVVYSCHHVWSIRDIKTHCCRGEVSQTLRYVCLEHIHCLHRCVDHA